MKVMKASQKMWTVHYPFSSPVKHRTRSVDFKAERSGALREGVCLFFLINITFIQTHYWISHGTSSDTGPVLDVTLGLVYRDN